MKLRTMKRNSQFRSPLAGVCSVLLMLCAGQPGFAQQSPESPSSGKPGKEGIKVHGQWVINVKNPDGTLAKHLEFENSLADGGYYLLTLMAGYVVPRAYAIRLSGNPCIQMVNNINTPRGCEIVTDPTIGFVDGDCVNAECFYGLVTTFNVSGNGPFSMVLAGSVTVPANGIISSVQTIDIDCGYASNAALIQQSPAACNASISGAPFQTLTSFSGPPLPVPVTAGQNIQVTVTISFS